MDIDGAKALKERLARGRAAKTPPASADVPEGAPPVYHWFAFRRSADGAALANDGLPVDDGSSSLGPGPLGIPPATP